MTSRRWTRIRQDALPPVWGCDRLVIRAKVIENQVVILGLGYNQLWQLQLSLFLLDSSDGECWITALSSYLFGDILLLIPSTSVVAQRFLLLLCYFPLRSLLRRTLVASPTGLCGLVPYTGFDSDSPDEMTSPEHISPLLERVRPFTIRRLASRHASPRSPDHHSSSSSSSSDSSPVHSLGLDAPDPAHSGSSTRDVAPRLCYPPRRAPQRRDSSERPMHLSSHSAGPSRKRCRSPVDSAPLSMPVTGSLAPTRADLSPPRKRFRDSYSSEASIEEDAEVGLTGTGVDLELGIGDGDEVGDHVGIDHRDARVDTEEYGFGRLLGLRLSETDGRSDQLIASGDRARMARCSLSLWLENLRFVTLLCWILRGISVSSLRIHTVPFAGGVCVRFRKDVMMLEGDLGG
ncbi:hypothetical protein Tco_0006308 [Tanacetum coccineum]